VRRTASEGRDQGGSSPLFLYTRGVKRDTPDPADERRGAPRIRPSRSARLLDISALGLAIETEADVTKGQMYDLILGLDDHRMPISARAVHVRKEGSLIRASFAFDRVLESDRQVLRQTLVREVVDRMTVLLR
jgi:PilZ domain